MTNLKLGSIISPAIVASIWLPGIKELSSIPEPVALIFTGVILLVFANIGKKKLKKN